MYNFGLRNVKTILQSSHPFRCYHGNLFKGPAKWVLVKFQKDQALFQFKRKTKGSDYSLQDKNSRIKSATCFSTTIIWLVDTFGKKNIVTSLKNYWINSGAGFRDEELISKRCLHCSFIHSRSPCFFKKNDWFFRRLRKTMICCSIHLCTHWLIFLIPYQESNHNLGVSRGRSNQLEQFWRLCEVDRSTADSRLILKPNLP